MSSIRKHFSVYALAIGFLATGIAGCHGNQNNTNQAQTQNAVATQAADESQDPAEQANLAPAASTTSETAQEQTPPPSENQSYDYNAPEADEPVTYASDPPPPLPDYDQPDAPGPDYMWTPGYWDYANTGYYWVPGAWVLAPYTGALWTPGYWGFYNNRYLWHRGYWGPHIGFYGGVNYGYGYTGVGYVGGYWDNGTFRYNTAVTRVNPSTIHDTYSHRVRVVTNRYVSYNGGRGGISARPLTAERVASREYHTAPLPSQTSHREQAGKDRSQWVSQNHGRPKTIVAARPLNEGRRAPAAMPANVRDQVQHEHAGHAPAARTVPTPVPHPENRRGQPARPQEQNQTHTQTRPEQNHPTARNETHAAPRTENRPANHPATRNEARPHANRPVTHTQTAHPAQTHPTARPETRHTRNQQSHSSHQERKEPLKNNNHSPQP